MNVASTRARHNGEYFAAQLPLAGAVLLWNSAMSNLGVIGLSLLGLTIGGTLMAVMPCSNQRLEALTAV